MLFRRLTFPLLALWLSFAGSLNGQARSIPIAINGRIPLGIESFRLTPAQKDFYLMSSVEDSSFRGMQRVVTGSRDYLIGGDGKKITHYPDRVEFRITASSREKLLDDRPFETHDEISLNNLFTKLKFRVKIFHGLEYRYVEPAYLEDVGMPRDIEYDERIYRIGFILGKIPIEDRVVMEVFSPSGQRLCKFHLDLL
jgi:hypothetical protein